LIAHTQSSGLRSANLRNPWGGGAWKRIKQNGTEPGTAITSAPPPPLKPTARTP
jgi:hypothetical protein